MQEDGISFEDNDTSSLLLHHHQREGSLGEQTRVSSISESCSAALDQRSHVDSTTSSSTVLTDAQLSKMQSRRERNRLASERCRRRKLDLIANLQDQCQKLIADLEAKTQEVERLLVECHRISLERDTLLEDNTRLRRVIAAWQLENGGD